MEQLRTTSECAHCGASLSGAASRFCCQGCETVYQWIRQQDLQKFYELQENAHFIRKAKAPSTNTDRFSYLDDPDFLKLYSSPTRLGRQVEFFLEGVHCAACVWLTEKVADRVDHVTSVRLNLGSSVASVEIGPQGTFSSVAREFKKMGYHAHPVRSGEGESNQKKENRRALARIGVAAACAGNIMLLSVSLYGGATGKMAETFRWLSLALFLPVLSFSAAPFFRGAWSAVRSKAVSIDIPVAFGLLLGAGVSLINLLTGDERVYFDSLSTLVFLLLSTRFLLKRTQQRAVATSRLMHFMAPASARKWNSAISRWEDVRLDEVRKGDEIQVLAGDAIPVDGVLIGDAATLDYSRLSGEAHPISVGMGDEVFAGTINLEGPIKVRVAHCGSETRMGGILSALEVLVRDRASISDFADRVARYFIAAVLVISVFSVLAALHGDWKSALNQALAFTIVACPCTFALITPLAFSVSLGRLAREGVLVKGPAVLEKLAGVRNVFLDKTGTLTFGAPQIMEWNIPVDLNSAILAIELQSRHPIARAIVALLMPQTGAPLPEVLDLQETFGLGVRGKIAGSQLEIRRAEPSALKGTVIEVFKDGVSVGTAVFRDQVRPDAQRAIEGLRASDLVPWILSGDRAEPVLQVGTALQIGPSNCVSEASPERKAEIVASHPNSLMVGDGANDALALATAEVGMAVRGGVEVSLGAADIYLDRDGVQSVLQVVTIARETLRVVRRNLWLSVIYNVVAGGFALAGKIDPLFAAVLMPASALTLFLSSIVGTRSLRTAFRELGR